MKRFEGMLLASDFDNTLAPTGKNFAKGLPAPEIPPENLAAIRRFMAEGGHFAVVTGRAYPAFLHLQPLIPTNTPTVLFNGAGIYDFAAGAYLWRSSLPADFPAHLREILSAWPRIGFETFLWDTRVFAYQPNDYIRRHQTLTRAPWQEIFSPDELREPVAKLLFEDENDVLRALERYLHARPWFSLYETTFSGPNLLEMAATGGNKGDAVRRLAAYCGVAPSRIYCAGDEENDLSMLHMAAAAFVPADCNPVLKQYNFRFVGPCTEHSVADAIALLDKEYR